MSRLFSKGGVLLNGITYEQLADELNNIGIWKFVSGFQKVDYNRRIALVVEDEKYHNLLVERGLEVNEVHVQFSFHKRRDPRIRVYLSQIPIGITTDEIKSALKENGDIVEVNLVTKVLHGCRFDTGTELSSLKELQCIYPCMFQLEDGKLL